MTFAELNAVAEFVETIVTIFAIVVGGIWSLRIYRQKRESLPRLDTEIPLPFVVKQGSVQIIRAQVALVNRGNVIFKCCGATLSLRVVVPIDEVTIGGIEEDSRNGFDPVNLTARRLVFPLVSMRKWSADELEIEPGETDSLHADFVVPSTYSVVELNFVLDNPSKKKSEKVWTVTRYIELERKDDHAAKQSKRLPTQASAAEPRVQAAAEALERGATSEAEAKP